MKTKKTEKLPYLSEEQNFGLQKAGVSFQK